MNDPKEVSLVDRILLEATVAGLWASAIITLSSLFKYIIRRGIIDSFFPST